MRASILLLLFSFLIISCNETENANYDTEVNVRMGYRFHKIEFDSSGNGIATKGTSTDYIEPFEQKNIEFTKKFKVQSIDSFISQLEKLSKNPIKTQKKLDAPRVEIKYKDKTIYDGYSWNSEFWDIVRPIMKEIPKESNPFMKQDDL